MTVRTTEDRDRLMRERECFQKTFGNPQGQAVLTALLNRLGFFATDPGTVNPECIAVANWILAKAGILTVENLPHYIGKIMSSASNDDIHIQNS